MAASTPEAEAPKKKSKLPIILAVVVLLLAGGGGGAWYFLMKPGDKEAHADAEGHDEAKADDDSRAEAHDEGPRPNRKPRRKSKRDEKAGPRQFVNLEPFTVNLRDASQDRFAQIGVVFEVQDNTVEGQINALNPAIRNALLILITSKSARDLLSVEGKKRRATEMVLATNAILDGDPAPPVRPAAPEAGAPGAEARAGADPDNRFAPPDARGGAHAAPAGQAPPQGAPGAYGAPGPYGAPNPYAQGNAYAANAYGQPPVDRYGRPLPAPWDPEYYDYPERVEAAHFSTFLIQ